MKWLHANSFTSRRILDDIIPSCASVYGHVDILRWLLSIGVKWDENWLVIATMGGHLDVCMWAHEQGYAWTSEACKAAAHYRHTDILRWARDMCGCECSEHKMVRAQL